MQDSNTPAALITAGARRIGKEIVQHLHSEGFNVIVHFNGSKNEAQSLIKELNKIRRNSAICLKTNFLDSINIADISASLIEKCIEFTENLQVIVNNAAIFKSNDVKTPNNHDYWDELFTINVKAPYYLSIAAFKYLKKNSGCIINITDIHAITPNENYPVYCQTKAALLMQTKCLAVEFSPLVRVNAIAPGAILMPEHENKYSEEKLQKILNNTLLNKTGNAKFIAQAVSFLINNKFINGQSINIDGGRYLKLS